MFAISAIVSAISQFFLKESTIQSRILIFISQLIIGFTSSIRVYTFFVEPLTFLDSTNLFLMPNIDMLLVSFSVNSIITSILITVIVSLDKEIINVKLRYSGLHSKRFFITKTISNSLALLLIFLSFLFLFSCYWAIDYFGELDINQIFYTLSQPLEGTSSSQMEDFIFNPLLNSVLVSYLCWLLISFISTYSLHFSKSYEKETKSFFRFILIPVSIVVLLGNLYFGISAFGFQEVKSALFDKTKIYEDYYVPSESVAITFPKTKRNLIHIFVESLEATYLSDELGGSQPDNLLPNLGTLALENTNFSHTSLIGGALTLPGTNFTAGGLVAQTSGTPVKTSINENEYGGNTKKYLPGISSLGEILATEGYRNLFLLGSDVMFSGRDKYFSQHGNYEIYDYLKAKEVGWIPEDYHVWWGYEDEKLYEFAKQQLLTLGDSQQPFNLTLLTADTHFQDGLMTENTPTPFDNQYSNVIHWTDEMLASFISFIMEQPFYENTTIVITGDHLSMDSVFFENLPDDYTRTVFNTIINPAVNADNSVIKNREFSELDIFPTTLAALGATIDGERLGLGTNLFSGEPTLIEELGYNYVYSELEKRSDYYTDNLMQGTDIAASIPISESTDSSEAAND